MVQKSWYEQSLTQEIRLLTIFFGEENASPHSRVHFLVEEQGFKYVANTPEAHAFLDCNNKIFCVKVKQPSEFNDTADSAREFIEQLCEQRAKDGTAYRASPASRSQRESEGSTCISFGYTLGPGSKVLTASHFCYNLLIFYIRCHIQSPVSHRRTSRSSTSCKTTPSSKKSSTMQLASHWCVSL